MTILARAPLAALLFLISILLVAFQLMFQMLYIGPVPVPVGTVIVLVSLPWLVHVTVTEISPTTAGAAAPVLLWFAAVLVLGMFGPGGDVLLPETWQSLLLLVAGAATGLVAFRRALENLAAAGRGRIVR
ncbi:MULTISPECIES: hypothetical protein [Pseudonocardia]|uniref:Uncharacterized protein n=2 Tax=Pseudonocardia TaxID=1847 RepID=A0A1Y2N5E3_PSEAH|nr:MULTISPECIES: hypothetical protein [Pseudonocardia]OSY42421.1 hypothetical protein BG845_01341 [Pseudonocardia autotrophica]TDN75941.1 hypothetical protein C8E95_5126 [Pseudonocardia autotrophica]BBF99913.1 hypothetical protein Pdca_11230 [Pseudonocardia autotrophica]GEC24972.1 hypothetical protein PSA01_20010 [Pseudonocardia saturnea]